MNRVLNLLAFLLFFAVWWIPENISINIELKQRIAETNKDSIIAMPPDKLGFFPISFCVEDTTSVRVIYPPKRITIGPEIKQAEDFEKSLEAKPALASNIQYYLLNEFKPKKKTHKDAKAYVKRFYKVAQIEQEKFGQPASVKLAQGLLESGKGTSYLARNANNHFGIKCIRKNCKRGHCVQREDDDPHDRFYIYQNAWHSYRAHSKFLSKKRYKPCFKKEGYKSWCKCLKKQGYATSKTYAEDLISTIEKYKLYQFDNHD